MAYKQTKRFNQAKGGSEPKMCLKNVRLGFGIAPRYDDAWTAWLNTEQHSGTPPKGLDTPVFFSYFAEIDKVYKNWGHIGVRLASGQFWSDGKLYASIAAYTNKHAPKYVGWGESLNGIKIIEGEEMYKAVFEDKEQNLSIKQWAAKAIHYRKRTLAEKLRADQASKALKIKDAEIKRLTAKLSVVNEDTELLNGFGTWLTKLIARLGLKK